MSDETKQSNPLRSRDEAQVRPWAVSQAKLLRETAIRLSSAAYRDVLRGPETSILHSEDGTSIHMEIGPDKRTVILSISRGHVIHLSYDDDGAPLRLDDPEEEIALVMRRLAMLDDEVEIVACDLTDGAIPTVDLILGSQPDIDPIATAIRTDNQTPRNEHVSQPGWAASPTSDLDQTQDSTRAVRLRYRLDEVGRPIAAISSNTRYVRIPSMSEIGPVEAMRTFARK